MSDVASNNNPDKGEIMESNILVPEQDPSLESEDLEPTAEEDKNYGIKRITRLPNDLNDLIFSKEFSRTGHNIFFTLVHKIRLKMPDIPPPANDEVPYVEISFTFYEIDEIAKISRSHHNRLNGESIKQTFEDFFKILWKQSFKTSKNEKTTYDRFIYKCTVDEKERDIKLFINYYIALAMYDYHIKCGYTSFEIGEFVCLKSIYSKTIYRKLKQWKTKGYWKVGIEEFRNLLSIPESYQMNDISKRVIKIAVTELSKELDLFDDKRIPFKNLKCEKLKKPGPGRGGSVVALLWTFDKHTTDKIPSFFKKEEANAENITDVAADVSDVENNNLENSVEETGEMQQAI